MFNIPSGFISSKPTGGEGEDVKGKGGSGVAGGVGLIISTDSLSKLGPCELMWKSKRMSKTRSWLLSNKQLREVHLVKLLCTPPNHLLLSNQEKGSTPSLVCSFSCSSTCSWFAQPYHWAKLTLTNPMPSCIMVRQHQHLTFYVTKFFKKNFAKLFNISLSLTIGTKM